VPIRRAQRHRTHGELIGARAATDRAALSPLPELPYLVCEKYLRRVGRDCLVSSERIGSMPCASTGASRPSRAYGRMRWPATDLHGLTPREMEVLGLLVEGCSNQEIARTLVVAPRTVATHLEHVLGKLGAPTRTLAAVRAERDGLYVPQPARAGREEGGQRPPDCSASSRRPLGVGR
jgi:DNA-binding CsgD family transcriptional regulator